jgi:hypothetical protein
MVGIGLFLLKKITYVGEGGRERKVIKVGRSRRKLALRRK